MGKWHKGRIRGFFRDGKRKVDLQLKQLADSGRPLDISLTNDFAFKKTFRNKIALTGLLSSLLDIPAGEITSLEFPDTFLHGEYAEDREGILDVKVRLNHCKKVNIEIQLLSHPFWEELERLNADKELRYLYLERLKAASDEATMQSYYKRLAEDAQKNGLAQGLETPSISRGRFIQRQVIFRCASGNARQAWMAFSSALANTVDSDAASAGRIFGKASSALTSILKRFACAQ